MRLISVQIRSTPQAGIQSGPFLFDRIVAKYESQSTIRQSYMIILENTLYSTPQELADLLKDKQKVADAFYLNFLGMLGLMAISSKRGPMKTYFQSDGQLQLRNIADTNNDSSVSVKLYHDVGGLRPDVATKLTRLLVKIKQRSITGKDLDDQQIRDLIGDIQILSHKPSQKVYEIVKSFLDGNATLQQVGKALFYLVKMRKKELMPVAGDFYNIAKGYGMYFKDVDDISSVPLPKNKTQAAAPAQGFVAPQVAAAPATPSVVQNSIKTLQNTTQYVAPVPIVPAPIGKTSAFYDELSQIRTLGESAVIFKKYGVSPSDHLDGEKLVQYIKTNGVLIHRIFAGPLALVSNTALKPLFSHMTSIVDSFDDGLELIELFNNSIIFRRVQPDLSERVEFAERIVGWYVDRIATKAQMDRLDLLLDAKISKFVSNQRIIITKSTPSLRDVFAWAMPGLAFGSAFTNTLDQLGINSTTAIKNGILHLTKPDFEKLPIPYRSLLNSELFKERVNIIQVSDVALALYEAKLDSYLISTLAKEATDSDWKRYLALLDSSFDYTKFGDYLMLTWSSVSSYYDLSYVFLMRKAMAHDRSDSYYEMLVSHQANGSKIDTHKHILQYCRGLSDEKTVMEVVNLKVKSGTYMRPHAAELWRIALPILLMRGDWYPIMMHHLPALLEDHATIPLLYNVVVPEAHTDALIEKYRWITGGSYMPELYTKFLTHLVSTQPDMEAAVNRILDVIADSDPLIVASMYGGSNTTLGIDQNKKFYTTLCHVVMSGRIKHSFLAKFEKSMNDAADDGVQFVMDSTITAPEIAEIYERFTSLRYLHKIQFDDYYGLRRAISDYALSLTHVTSLLANKTDDEIKALCHDDIGDYFARCMRRTSKLEYVDPKTIARFGDIIFTEMESDKKKYKKATRDHFLEKFLEIFVKIDGLGDQSKTEAMWNTITNRNIKKQYVQDIIDVKFFEVANQEILKSDAPIRPYDVSGLNIKTLLDINQVSAPASETKILKSTTALQARINAEIEATGLATKVEPIKAVKVELSEEELERVSVDYDKFNRYFHGNIAMKVLRAYDVSIPRQATECAKFAAEHPNMRTHDQMFHGTGSIAATMIMRFGFTVVKSNNSGPVKTTGKMLGDGIYGAKVLDKVAQYVGDDGFTRKIGTRGYVFEMAVQYDVWGRHLNKDKSADWASAGGVGDGYEAYRTGSPEWAFRGANNQTRIYRCYEVEIISKDSMDALKAKYVDKNESMLTSFKEFINENKKMRTKQKPYYKTFIFMDGSIPVGEGKMVEWEEFNKHAFGKHVGFDGTRSGPAIMFRSDEQETKVIRWTRDFMHTEDFKEYLKLLKGK